MKFNAKDALIEHLLQGHRVSLLEALLLFGVQSLTADLKRLKDKGFLVESESVSMAKVLRRINEYTVCQAPKNLPYREITMTEYWIAK